MFKISKIFFETIERPIQKNSKEFKNNVKFYEKKDLKFITEISD